jgi:uncharacterized membrane protein YeaQ/YmgE (transglycosylase-associated protein family)
MAFRIALQPLWLRWSILALFMGVFVGIGTSLASSHPSSNAWATAVPAGLVGVIVGGLISYRGEPLHKALVDAGAALGNVGLRQAIAAFAHGVVPADPAVRAAAVSIGSAYFGGKSPDALRRDERLTLLILALLVVGCVAGAIVSSNLRQRVFFLALGVVAAAGLLGGLRRTREFHRNLALLTEHVTPH